MAFDRAVERPAEVFMAQPVALDGKVALTFLPGTLQGSMKAVDRRSGEKSVESGVKSPCRPGYLRIAAMQGGFCKGLC
jgi:hypothetical protein